jgi:hypothetical protein
MLLSWKTYERKCLISALNSTFNRSDFIFQGLRAFSSPWFIFQWLLCYLPSCCISDAANSFSTLQFCRFWNIFVFSVACTPLMTEYRSNYWRSEITSVASQRLEQWYSMRGTRRHLRGYVTFKKRKYYFIINTEWSGPDLGLATGDLDIQAFDSWAPFYST